MNYKKHTNCRACNSDDLSPYLFLGYLPLSNNLCKSKDEKSDKYRLEVALCNTCGLSQLTVVVNPSVLFGNYVYRSSINKGYVNHCRRMAMDLKRKMNLTENSFMIDIAGNDGALLREFKSEIGLKVLNVDPAENLYELNENSGVRMYTSFWGSKAAKHLETTQWPMADLITATNVIAHVDNIHDFMSACARRLKLNGRLVLEFPYLIDFIENNEFDTVYFEHLSYLSIMPLHSICIKAGLNIEHVERQDIHGGSVRVTIGHNEVIKQSEETSSFIANEIRNYRNLAVYLDFAEKSKQIIDEFKKCLTELKNDDKRIVGFAASAKGNTLLNCAGITSNEMSYIIDETPEKIGKYSPGTGIPIFPLDIDTISSVDYIVILSWNFKQEIIAKCRSLGYIGQFIIPIPDIQII